jgi:acetyl-CoA carboxylase biotin carboxyl carrier protein
MDFNQIQELIRLVSKQKISEFIYKEGDFKLVIRQGSPVEYTVAAPVAIAAPPPVMAPVVAAPAPAPKAEAPAPAEPEFPKAVVVKSPMVGTFYRSPGADKASFVKVGDDINIGATVCIIEAMKLFNEIESDVKGRIVKVLVEDASPVEYDQPLFLVEPA